MDTIQNRVMDLMTKMGYVESFVAPETTLDELGLDSLDIVELAIAVDEEFDLEIPDENIEEFVTVGDVIQYVEGEMGK